MAIHWLAIERKAKWMRITSAFVVCTYRGLSQANTCDLFKRKYTNIHMYIDVKCWFGPNPANEILPARMNDEADHFMSTYVTKR
jgi:hypothetical protein